MKLKFDPGLDYQIEAVSSAVDIFQGQEACRSTFTVSPLSPVKENSSPMPGMIQNGLGVGNRLLLERGEILRNLRSVQLRNGLPPSESLESPDFCVEMETGTGKTYVYLRTIFELHKHYGFTKFIIVVPSVAIKEGVYKSLQMTADHFRSLYDNVQFEYFVYDSQKLGQVRNFATDDHIQIMLINIDAFRKSFTHPEQESKANIIHRPHDRMSGNKPIEFVQATNPVVIIDEPQSVDRTAKSKEAVASLNPMCTLRYSATHVDRYNMIYRLDAVDAYRRKLVKQIEVNGIEVKDSFNIPYIKLLEVDNRKRPIKAKIELDVRQKDGSVKRQTRTVRSGQDLMEVSGGRDIYEGYIIEEIYCAPGREYISFTSKPEIISLHQAIGVVENDEYKRLQIRKTIEEHLDKELALRPQGIKVLSLFFIDKVANYRWYDQEGRPRQGKFARMFEEEYVRAMRKPKYESLLEQETPDVQARMVHNGYFAVDKKKDASGHHRLKDSRGEARTQADENAYQLIMKDKEQLLSFQSSLQFIFSHSALKEGWDNPNVFQICTLNETASMLKKRQEIGRGLRIAVNQDGERVHGFEVNTLTVMANESYEDFARQLQDEIEQDEGIRFGVVLKHSFTGAAGHDVEDRIRSLGVEDSERLWKHLHEKGYIDSQGRIQDALRLDLKKGTLDLPPDMQAYAPQIINILTRLAGELNIKNARNKQRVGLNKAVYLSPEFKELWDRIKHKTTYRVEFDTGQLISTCAREIRENLLVSKPRLVSTKARLDVDRGGVSAETFSESFAVFEAGDYTLPDIITYLQNQTNLTRRTLVEILTASQRLDDFSKNPQKFIKQVSDIITRKMRMFLVDGIKYQKIGRDHYYAQELFQETELFGYLSRNMLESSKSVYDHVVYDSQVEKDFARSFEQAQEVKVYAKLPQWFVIDTPLGGYNPDWAVLVEVEGQKRLYFVVETKGSLSEQDMRPGEQARIQCGQEHFKALDQGVRFKPADSFETFRSYF